MKYSKFIAVISTYSLFVKTEMCFSEDNALKNAVVFVLLSQKMKITF